MFSILTMEQGSSSTRPATFTSLSTLSANNVLRGERNGVANHNKGHGKERQGQRWQKKTHSTMEFQRSQTENAFFPQIASILYIHTWIINFFLIHVKNGDQTI